MTIGPKASSVVMARSLCEPRMAVELRMAHVRPAQWRVAVLRIYEELPQVKKVFRFSLTGRLPFLSVSLLRSVIYGRSAKERKNQSLDLRAAIKNSPL